MAREAVCVKIVPSAMAEGLTGGRSGRLESCQLLHIKLRIEQKVCRCLSPLPERSTWSLEDIAMDERTISKDFFECRHLAPPQMCTSKDLQMQRSDLQWRDMMKD